VLSIYLTAFRSQTSLIYMAYMGLGYMGLTYIFLLSGKCKGLLRFISLKDYNPSERVITPQFQLT
jgi:hypothetical protein